MNATSTLPCHIAIVMDGNGRWARLRNQPRSFGHRAGKKAMRETVEGCLRQGIGTLTLFAFSSENWQRPESEVRALMALFMNALDKEVDALHEQSVRLRFIGDLEAFGKSLQCRMHEVATHTAKNKKLNLNLAVSYGGRWDISQAARRAAADVVRGELKIEDIDEVALGCRMNLSDLPPPDLLIRTGGEHRISNFLLWQMAYTELHFTDTLWPAFDRHCLQKAVDDYGRRERRYGRIGSQTTRRQQDSA